jgi:hypothetical protein
MDGSSLCCLCLWGLGSLLPLSLGAGVSAAFVLGGLMWAFKVTLHLPLPLPWQSQQGL